MKYIFVLAAILGILFGAIQTWFAIPETTLNWFLDTMGIPLPIVTFLSLILAAIVLAFYLVWLLRDKIVAKGGALIERIGPNKAPAFKCNFSKDVLAEVLSELYESVKGNVTESDKSNQEKILRIVWEDVNKLLATVNKCLVSYDKKDDYHKSQEVHNELTTRMLELEQILEGTPEPNPFSEDSLQEWQLFLSVTKGKMKKGEFELKNRSKQ